MLTSLDTRTIWKMIYTMNKYPIVYRQVKLLKAIWEKSNAENKTEIIAVLSETLKEIEMEYRYV